MKANCVVCGADGAWPAWPAPSGDPGEVRRGTAHAVGTAWQTAGGTEDAPAEAVPKGRLNFLSASRME